LSKKLSKKDLKIHFMVMCNFSRRRKFWGKEYDIAYHQIMRLIEEKHKITNKFVDKWIDHFVVMKYKSVLSRRNIETWVRRMLKEFRE